MFQTLRNKIKGNIGQWISELKLHLKDTSFVDIYENENLFFLPDLDVTYTISG